MTTDRPSGADPDRTGDLRLGRTDVRDGHPERHARLVLGRRSARTAAIPSRRPSSRRAAWSTRAPTCSTSAASRPGRAMPRSTPRRRSAASIPVIAAIRAALPGMPLSIDTTKVVVAEAALAAGADLPQRRLGHRARSGDLAELAAQRRRAAAGHAQPASRPRYDDVVREVVDDLARGARPGRARRCSPTDLLVDPGIGFGKTADHNVIVLRHLGALRTLGSADPARHVAQVDDRADPRPARPRSGSRARWPRRRSAIAAGVDIVRVHDVQANVRAARVSDAIVRGRWRSEPEGGPA